MKYELCSVCLQRIEGPTKTSVRFQRDNHMRDVHAMYRIRNMDGGSGNYTYEYKRMPELSVGAQMVRRYTDVAGLLRRL